MDLVRGVGEAGVQCGKHSTKPQFNLDLRQTTDAKFGTTCIRILFVVNLKFIFTWGTDILSGTPTRGNWAWDRGGWGKFIFIWGLWKSRRYTKPGAVTAEHRVILRTQPTGR